MSWPEGMGRAVRTAARRYLALEFAGMILVLSLCVPILLFGLGALVGFESSGGLLQDALLVGALAATGGVVIVVRLGPAAFSLAYDLWGVA